MIDRIMWPVRQLMVLSLLLSFVGCATYTRLPLPEKPDLAATVGPKGSPPLDMNAVATVAVLNNPDLKASRAAAQVAEAQAFSAGLLPNPQFSGTLDRPTDSTIGLVDAYGLGLTLDLQALLLLPSKKAAANAARDQKRLDLLWQEWQTVAQARSLYVQSVLAAEKRQFLGAVSASVAMHATHAEHALQAGDLAPEQASGDVAVLFDVRTRLGTAQRSALLADQSLRSLLGLGPEVTVPLQPLDSPELPERAAVAIALGQLAHSRPDLRALQAGYESQEERVRGSVLSQFPNISVSFAKARDTGDVHTNGLGVTLNLPLFDRGQGAIAIERATRAQLRAEYEARLDQATGDAWRLWSEMQEVVTEIQDLKTYMPQLQSTVADAERSYASGDLPVPAYLTMLNALLNGKSSLLDLQQSLWTDAIALSTVLGTQIQPAAGTKDSK
jgi:outer membrane protein, heavy metal efflux system